MSRPLRIEFPGAVYHVTARGDRRESIFDDDDDRQLFLSVLAQALERFDALALAYCLMGNHYHLVLHTRAANLSRLMRHLNGVYTQSYNRRHGKVGHLLQGRFKAILVDREAYLLTVCRYVELNPVRAGMVEEPSQWGWSSYLAHVGRAQTPAWLDTLGLHAYLLGREVRSAADARRAAKRYAELVCSAPDLRLWEQGLRQQIYLGSEDFVTRMQEQVRPQQLAAPEIPRAQRKRAKSALEQDPLQALADGPKTDADIARCYRDSGLTMAQIAAALGVSVPTISRRVMKGQRGA
jgi:REP element-mobilizing transposase RayT/DNA-directed RNA polymerase specialized sigma24 family protein